MKTKMRCPVCGAKIKHSQFCPYCQDVSVNQIRNASNTAAKQFIKEKRKNEVVFSNFLPEDISKKKLWLLTLLLGWAGGHLFYVGRKAKASFYLASISATLALVVLDLVNLALSWGQSFIINWFLQIAAFCGAITFVLWAGDIIALMSGTFKVPVVLGKKEADIVKGSIPSQQEKKKK